MNGEHPNTREAQTTEQETYLGDAVYASFDGWQIRPNKS